MATAGRITPLLICCLLHAGCGMTTDLLGSRVAVEKMPGLPGDWGDFAAHSTDEFGCPDVDGDYRMVADVYEIRDSEEGRSTSTTLILFNLFIGPLDAERVEISPSERGPLLSFQRTDADALILRSYAERTDREITWRLSVGAPGLDCVDGFYELPVREYHSAGEFYYENSQVHSRFARLGDGSLLYYEQVGPRKRLLGAGAKFTHRFYRFRPLGQEIPGGQGKELRRRMGVQEGAQEIPGKRTKTTGFAGWRAP